ncbi:MAG: hypothetical protein EOP64_00155 [Sphingomonas sp.]|nr:MAG: hypothetical protein EOP64_00155 [Sphingomonas sp.]
MKIKMPPARHTEVYLVTDKAPQCGHETLRGAYLDQALALALASQTQAGRVRTAAVSGSPEVFLDRLRHKGLKW